MRAARAIDFDGLSCRKNLATIYRVVGPFLRNEHVCSPPCCFALTTNFRPCADRLARPGDGDTRRRTVIIGDLTFVNQALVGVGRLPADLRDKFGETFGSGSAIAVDPKSWVRTPAGYQGTFYMLPDRGYNVTGTSDYRARINKLFITFTPLDDPMAVPIAQRQSSVAATLTDTILLTDAAGQSLTGLDPDGIRPAANGLPDLPQASNGRVSIDSES